MNEQIFLKWLKINSLCFIGAFIVTFLIVQLFPNAMLGFWGGWASLIEQNIIEFLFLKSILNRMISHESLVTFSSLSYQSQGNEWT